MLIFVVHRAKMMIRHQKKIFDDKTQILCLQSRIGKVCIFFSIG